MNNEGQRRARLFYHQRARKQKQRDGEEFRVSNAQKTENFIRKRREKKKIQKKGAGAEN
tara:strand:- start:207 stop:383 length:177 start_codon:yes stop_codon:yes gene_type:complete